MGAVFFFFFVVFVFASHTSAPSLSEAHSDVRQRRGEKKRGQEEQRIAQMFRVSVSYLVPEDGRVRPMIVEGIKDGRRTRQARHITARGSEREEQEKEMTLTQSKANRSKRKTKHIR